jgi:hypothetical protein
MMLSDRQGWVAMACGVKSTFSLFFQRWSDHITIMCLTPRHLVYAIQYDTSESDENVFLTQSGSTSHEDTTLTQVLSVIKTR